MEIHKIVAFVMGVSIWKESFCIEIFIFLSLFAASAPSFHIRGFGYNSEDFPGNATIFTKIINDYRNSS